MSSDAEPSTDLAAILKDLRRLGNVATDDGARRWLRATASTLAEWGGADARDVLSAALPKDALSGAGTRGRPLAKTRGAEGEAATDDVALYAEIGKRFGEEDPGKIAQVATPALALIRRQLTETQLARLVTALPPAIATELRTASDQSPWRFRLIPQSYARKRA